MKVRAKNDEIKNVLYHPTGGRFRDDGTAEWPDDTYTYRRIEDGDVIVDEATPEAAKKSKTKEA
jgi:hypothetical protein